MSSATAEPRPEPVLARPAAGVPARGARLARLALAAIYVVAAAIFTALALREKVPSTFPDEYTYGHLAKSVAAGDGLDWFGAPLELRSLLYVYFIAPSWLIASGTDAYAIAKVEGVLALCTIVFPVWWMAREFVGERLALVPAALSVMGTWTVMGAGVLTETLALPLGTASLAATVLCLRRPCARLAWLALGFAALSTLARLQMLVLFPVIFAGAGLDVALRGRAWRERAREQRVLLLTGAALVVLGTIVLAVRPSTVGSYEGIFHAHRPLGETIRKAGLQLGEFVAVCGFVPALVGAAAALLPSSWRSDRLRPLLIVFVIATAGFVAVSGAFLAGYPAASWGIERYVYYSAPIALVLLVVIATEPGMRLGRVLAIAAALSAALLLMPPVRAAGEERALRTVVDVLDGLVGDRQKLILVVAALGGLALTALAVRAGRGNRALAVAAVAGVGLVVLAIGGWSIHHTVPANQRAQLPPDLEWIDHNSHGPVGVLQLKEASYQFADLAFFSDRLARIYDPRGKDVAGRPLPSTRCTWSLDATTGAVKVDHGCPPIPKTLLVNGAMTRLTFQDEVRSVSDPHAGRLVEIDGPVRLRSVLELPCGPRLRRQFLDTNKVVPADQDDACGNTLVSTVWPARAGRVEFRFKPGTGSHVVTSRDGRQWVLPPGRETTVSVPVKAGLGSVALTLDWASRNGNPELVAADLVEGGERQSML